VQHSILCCLSNISIHFHIQFKSCILIWSCQFILFYSCLFVVYKTPWSSVIFFSRNIGFWVLFLVYNVFLGSSNLIYSYMTCLTCFLIKVKFQNLLNECIDIIYDNYLIISPHLLLKTIELLQVYYNFSKSHMLNINIIMPFALTKSHFTIEKSYFLK
jgi:hypothetical protein